MEIPEVHPLNFALRYTPPTLVMHYFLGNDQTQELVHQVKVFLKESVTIAQVINELVREEPLYFAPHIVPKAQLERLVKKLIDNNGKKVGQLKLLRTPVAPPAKKEAPAKEPAPKPAVKEPAPKPAKEQVPPPLKELKPKEAKEPPAKQREKEKVVIPAPAPPKEVKTSPEILKDVPIEDDNKVDDFVEDMKSAEPEVKAADVVKPEAKPEVKLPEAKAEPKPKKEEKSSPEPVSDEAGSSPEDSKGPHKKKKNIRERLGLGHQEAKANSNDILVEDDKPDGGNYL